jgi:hypothetical protein
MSGVDYQGIAFIIAALGGLVTPGLAVALFVRQGRLDRKLDDVHVLVNGVSHELADAKKKIAFDEGTQAGIIAERAAPMIPDPSKPPA